MIEIFKLSLNNFKEINASMNCLLHATQYIAIAGKYLIAQEPDDSNTNFIWSEQAKSFIGRKVTKGQVARIGINALDLELQIMDVNGKVLSYFPLHEQTKEDGFNFMKNALERMGINVLELSMEMHYKITEMKKKNKKFIKPNKIIMDELAHYRTNANRTLEYYASLFPHAYDVRIWPHHFDTGSYIPLIFGDNQKVLKSIGIGFAIADSLVNEPYYYISHWVEDDKPDYTNLPHLKGGGKWITSNWIGAVLSVNSLVKATTAEKQASLINEFFVSGINATLQLFNNQDVYNKFRI